MTLQEEIKNNLNRGFTERAMRINSLPEEYPAWTIKRENWYGVAVPVNDYKPFSEEFANARIWMADQVLVEGRMMNCLILSCSDPLLRNSFSIVCSQFADPGENGIARMKLVSDPVSWWKEWKNLLGNRNSETEVYSVLGELIIVEKLLRNGKQPYWGGPSGSVHDIECTQENYEVKSTLQRHDVIVKISSVFQMEEGNKPLSLVFCRFEESESGVSLNEKIKVIEDLGYPETEIENKLTRSGLEKGKTARDRKYKLLETRVYSVDENFPAITKESFVDGKIPERITRLTYEVNLSDLYYKSEP